VRPPQKCGFRQLQKRGFRQLQKRGFRRSTASTSQKAAVLAGLAISVR
jgi:hypothetical protein